MVVTPTSLVQATVALRTCRTLELAHFELEVVRHLQKDYLIVALPLHPIAAMPQVGKDCLIVHQMDLHSLGYKVEHRIQRILHHY